MSYQIITDSSCDLPLETLDEMKVKVVPFYVSFDDVVYKKEKYEVSTDEFYQKMVDNKKIFPKSSLPSVQDYMETFMPYAKEGIDIICICISTKFSGSYNSATNAATIINEDYPDVKITVIDAMMNTVLHGILVKEIIRMRDNGLSYQEVVENTRKIIPTGRIVFTVGGVEYLKKGGRIGKVLISATSVLGVKPLIILKDGEIHPAGVTRNRKKSLQMVIDGTKKHFKETGENPADYEFCIGYGYDAQEIQEFKKDFLLQAGEELGLADVNIYKIGTVIACHTGPYAVGVAFIRRYDTM